MSFGYALTQAIDIDDNKYPGLNACPCVSFASIVV